MMHELLTGQNITRQSLLADLSEVCRKALVGMPRHAGWVQLGNLLHQKALAILLADELPRQWGLSFPHNVGKPGEGSVSVAGQDCLFHKGVPQPVVIVLSSLGDLVVVLELASPHPSLPFGGSIADH